MIKLIFLLPLRYPTEKAYGVTIGNTFSKIKKNLFDCRIWCDTESLTDSYGNTLEAIKLPKIHPKLFGLSRKVSGLIIYFLRLVVFAIKSAIKICKLNKEIYLWTRHPLTLIFSFNSEKVTKLIIEFHHSPNLIDKCLTRIYANTKKVFIICITDQSLNEINILFPKVPAMKAEMAVPDQYIVKSSMNLPKKIIGSYIGKGSSSGHDNNIDFIIDGLSYLDSNLDFEFRFIGLEPEYKIKLIQKCELLNLSKEKIIFIDHAPHEAIAGMLSELSIGVIPYRWNEYNSHRYPIKLVEYAASGLWILSDSEFAEGLKLDEKLAKRYKSGDPKDFAVQLFCLFQQISSTKLRNLHAIEFAENHTYSIRASNIIKNLSQK